MGRSIYFSCALTFALGLLFIFVWAPHPWGWDGFDRYHELGLTLARGGQFETMEVPWGYAYFLAAFYRLFGDRPWIPLLFQAALNATIPLLVFNFARTWLDARESTVAAVLAGVFSFNTVYASTQSSDAACTWLFMAGITAFAIGRRRDDWRWFAGAGLATGLAPQFRPNLILIPLVLAAFIVVERRSRRALTCAALIVAGAAAILAPWIVRNYQLTRSVLPTSVHGGVQLWYGTLQVGPYLNSRAYNPQSVFDTSAFEYSSLLHVPIEVRSDLNACSSARPVRTSLIYWTDRDPTRRQIDQLTSRQAFAAELPSPGGPAVLYYFFDSECPDEPAKHVHHTPPLGAAAPFVYFLSENHLGDLDTRGDLLDMFDLVRLVRRDAWGEPLPFAAELTAAGVADLRTAIQALLPIPSTGPIGVPPTHPRTTADRATLVLPDGSSIVVPRKWSGLVTDLTLDGGEALALLHSTASLAELRVARADGSTFAGHARAERSDVEINRVFYRREPHMMRRYTALAVDNIRRDPVAFVFAASYRALRLFIIAGTDDVHTAQQFSGSRLVYAAATIASVAYLLSFAAGVAIAWRRHDALWLPVLLVAYVPLTLAPVLTNMRYTITVQPLIFMFVAVALMAAIHDRRVPAARREESCRGETRTARQL